MRLGRHRLIVALALGAITVVGRADFDKTRWGMTVREVQRVYPGGVARRLATGQVEYSVARNTGGFPTWSMFTFDRSGLVVVTLVFSHYVDYSVGAKSMSREDAEAIGNTIRGELVTVYGEPSQHSADGDIWDANTVDVIGFGVVCTSPGCNPVVQYMSVQYGRRQLGNGL